MAMPLDAEPFLSRPVSAIMCGGDLPPHAVDVQRIEEAAATWRGLDIPRCCDWYAGKFLFSFSSCCFLFILLPTLGLSLHDAAATAWPATPWPQLLLGASAALVGLGVVLCCSGCMPMAASAVNPPEPGPCVAPLVARELNASHQEQKVKRVAIVYNPHAGKGKALALLREVVLPQLLSAGVEVEEIPTQRVGHAREIGYSKNFTGFDGVISMGGDGTLHELANGLLARSIESAGAVELPPVGVIPMGSGNALASDFRQNQRRRGAEISIYRELETVADWSLDRIVRSRSCCLDVLEFTTRGERVFGITLCFLGLIADIDVMAEPLRCLGPARFDFAGVWGILKRRPMAPCRIELKGPDGSRRVLSNILAEGGELWLALALNLGQHWSDSSRSSPSSRLDDGVAELHIMKLGTSRRQLLQAYGALSTGSHASMPGAEDCVETFPFTELTMTFPHGESAATQRLKDGLFDVDGEMFCHDGSLRVRVLPRKFRMFCDPDAECAKPGEADHVPNYDAPQALRWRWVNLFLFSLCSIANQIVWITFAPIATTTSAAFGVSTSFVNMLAMCYMVLYIPFTFPASHFIDRLGCRPALLLGVLLTACGAGLRIAGGSLNTGGSPYGAWVLLAGQSLAAVGQPFITNMPPKLAHVWFPKHQQTGADTIASMSAAFGAAVGMLLPNAIINGDPALIGQLLMVEAAIPAALLLVILLLFKSDPEASDPAALLRLHAVEHRSVLAESREALQDKDFRAVAAAFAFGQGSFNVMGAMIQQLVAPFGFDEDDASTMGALVVFCGLGGAVVCAVMIGYTHDFRQCLQGCFVGATMASVAIATLVPLNARAAAYVAVAAFGATMTPVMPISFETSVELMHSSVGEAVLSGLCMTGGQVVGLVATLIFGALCDAGRQGVALWLVMLATTLGLLSISKLNKQGVGQRRRNIEAEERARRAPPLILGERVLLDDNCATDGP